MLSYWFLKKLKHSIKETRSYHLTFLFFYVRWLVFYQHCAKNFKTFQKNVSIPRMDEKKLHTREFQLKGIGGNMSCKLLQKRSTGKTTECSKQLQHIAIEKDLFSELKSSISQISLTYIKLVIPKILLTLVLCSLTFTSKLRDPSPSRQQNNNFWAPPPPPPAKVFF